MKSGGIFERQNGVRGGVETTPLRLVLAAALSAGLVIPTPTLGGVDKKVADVCHRTTDAATRAKYCSAAKDLKQGYNANIATSAVWTGVAVACGTACGKATGPLVCNIARMGGSAGEGVITKKFSDSLMGEGSKWLGGGEKNSGATEAAAPAAETGGETIANAKGGVNVDACTTSGTSALKAFGKYSDSKQTDKSLTTLRDQTKEMNSPTGSKVAFTGDTQTSGASNDSNQSAAVADTGPCATAAIGTALGAIRCAATSDPTLPPYVKSEEFLKDLQKATGKSPDAFFANFESPAKAIADSPLVEGMSEAQQKGLVDSMDAMEGYSDAKAAKVAAASSGSGGEAGASLHLPTGDDTGFDVNGMIAGMLGQLGGADGKDAANVNAGAGLAVDRRPAGTDRNAAEDRKISLFDRVKWRYGAVSARDRLGVP